MYRSLSVFILSFFCGAGAVAADSLPEPEPIPHGAVAVAEGMGVVAAWYACPTQRYRHAVLGDDIEGGCLMVRDSEGNEYAHTLDEQYVFEDVTPRIADMDGDGRNDIVTIRSDVDAGAALVMYHLAKDESGTMLEELAATPPIGRANRWLAPAGIADFNNDGRNDVAYVQTPHIGGILRVWTMLDQGFTEVARVAGLSNHSIGSKRVSISRVLDDNDDGVADIAIPDQSGTQTIVLTLHPSFKELRRMPFDVNWFDEN